MGISTFTYSPKTHILKCCYASPYPEDDSFLCVCARGSLFSSVSIFSPDTCVCVQPTIGTAKIYFFLIFFSLAFLIYFPDVKTPRRKNRKKIATAKKNESLMKTI